MDDNASVRGVILTGNRDAAGPAGWDGYPDLLLPLANVSMIERILDAYERAGVTETLIAAGQDSRQAASICGSGARWNMVLTYEGQPEARGPLEIMKDVASFAGEAVTFATRGPVLLNAEAYVRAVQMYDENSLCGIRLWEREGKASIDGHGSDGSAGIYLLSPDASEFVIDCCGTGDRACSFGSILDTLAGRGGRVTTLTPGGEPYDTITPEAYLASNERLLESVFPETGPLEIIDDNFSSPNLVTRPPVIVDATAELERCRIGPGVCIGPGARIGHGAAIEHSVIMAGADIGDGASISHAVIGRNAGVENRAILHGRADRVLVVRSK